MALSILPYLMKTAAKKNGLDKEIVILTATSGDTGKAALEGFANVEGTRIMVFFPEDGVSPVQKLQMNTQEGANTCVVGIKGNFEDAQSAVKSFSRIRRWSRSWRRRDSNFLRRTPSTSADWCRRLYIISGHICRRYAWAKSKTARR